MNSKFVQLLAVLCLAVPLLAFPCVRGQWTDYNGTCHPCPANCSACASDTNCLECVSSDFYLTRVQDSLFCLPCHMVLTGCVNCLAVNVCSQCRDRYYLTDNICRTCESKFPSCDSCAPDGS